MTPVISALRLMYFALPVVAYVLCAALTSADPIVNATPRPISATQKHQLASAPPLAHDAAHAAERTLLHDHFVARRVVDALGDRFGRRAIPADRVAQSRDEAVGEQAPACRAR